MNWWSSNWFGGNWWLSNWFSGEDGSLPSFSGTWQLRRRKDVWRLER